MQCMLRYYSIDNAKVQHAVQELHQACIILCVGIIVHPENADGGVKSHEYTIAQMHDRVQGIHHLLLHLYTSVYDTEPVGVEVDV